MSMEFAFEHSRSGTPVPPPSDPVLHPVPAPEPFQLTVPGNPNAPHIATIDASGVVTPIDSDSRSQDQSPIYSRSSSRNQSRDQSRARAAQFSYTSLRTHLGLSESGSGDNSHNNNSNSNSNSNINGTSASQRNSTSLSNIDPPVVFGSANMQVDSDLDLPSDNDNDTMADRNSAPLDRIGRSSQRTRSRSRGTRSDRSHNLAVIGENSDLATAIPLIPSYLTATAYGERYSQYYTRAKAERQNNLRRKSNGFDLMSENGINGLSGGADSAASASSLKPRRTNDTANAKTETRPATSNLRQLLNRSSEGLTAQNQQNRQTASPRLPILPQIFTSRSAIGLDDRGVWIGEELSLERAAAAIAAAEAGSLPRSSSMFLSDSTVALPQVSTSSSSSSSPQLPTAPSSASTTGPTGAAAASRCPPPLPCKWDDRGLSSVMLTDRGTRIEYSHGKSTSSSSSSSSSHSVCLRADTAIPPLCGVFYYEVKIEAHGGDQLVSVGICKDTAPLQKIPGNDQESWGYHTDDGRICVRSEAARSFGPRIQAGDVLGCGLNFATSSIFYTKNGLPLGTAFSAIPISKSELFPCIGLKSGEVVSTNFGADQFLFDIDKYVADEKKKVLDLVMNNTDPLPDIPDEAELIKDLISAYFAHVGYIDTSRAFEEDRKRENQPIPTATENDDAQQMDVEDESPPLSSSLVDVVNRRRVYKCVLEGDIDGAFKLLTTFYPNVLPTNNLIHFKLQCRKFVELVRDPKRTADAIAYGRNLHTEYHSSPQKFIQLYLKTMFAVLAYPDPSTAPEVAHILDKDGLVSLAEELNSAILVSQGKPGNPSLQLLADHAATLTWILADQGDARASLINVKEDFFR